MREIEFLQHSLGPYIGKASRMLEKRMNENFAQAGYDITLEHWIVLIHLWLEDGRNQKTICEFAGRHKTHIKRSIDSLEKQNLVLRVPDQTDKRNKLIYLTHKGRSIKPTLFEIVEKTIAQASEGVSQEDIEICIRVLNQVFFNLADEKHIKHFTENSFIRNDNPLPNTDET